MPTNADFQMVERHVWIPSLNIEFLIGIDGISVLFLPMSALLTLVAIIASWNSVQHLTRFHFALLLIMEGGTMGVFVALDMMLFFLFWELILPPIFFLIGLWGAGPQRRGAAMKYMLYMLFSGVPLLFALIMLGVNHAMQTGGSIPHDLSFSFPVLLKTHISDDLQVIIFLLLLTGFAVKAPLAAVSYLVAHYRRGSADTTDCIINRVEIGRIRHIAFCHAANTPCVR